MRSGARVSKASAGSSSSARPANATVGYLRFGFVDTKMAKAKTRPFMISRQVAASVVLRALRTRQRRVSFPVRTALLVTVLSVLQRVKRFFS